MIRDRKLLRVSSIAGCLIALSFIGTNAHGRSRRPKKEFTQAQYEAKYERLRTAMARVTRSKERKNLSRAIKEAREAVKIAEEEFGSTSLVIANPIFVFIKLLGKKRLYEEAEENLKKIYVITDTGGDSHIVYAIGYRISIARIYLEWNMFEKAESTLIAAQKIIEDSKLPYADDPRYRFTSDHYGNYTKQINIELKKISELKVINQFSAEK